MIHFLGDLKFLHPTHLNEASTLLNDLIIKKENFFIYGGGTDLVPYLKNYSVQPTTMISLNRIESLKKIHLIGFNEIEIGSQIKLSELTTHPLLKEKLKGLADAAAQVASPQIRNQATLGGNLLVNNRCRFFNQSSLNRSYHDNCYKAGGEICHLVKNAKRGDPVLCRARFVSDLAPVLLTLEAKLRLLSPQGERFLPLKDFYLSDGIHRNQLLPNEILVSICISLAPKRQVAYEKLRIRKAIDFPSLGVAVGWVDGNDSANDKSSSGGCCGCCGGNEPKKKWLLALTGVHTHPILVSETEMGSPQKTIAELSAAASKKSQPLKQDFLSPTYRKKMISVLAERALTQLLV